MTKEQRATNSKLAVDKQKLPPGRLSRASVISTMLTWTRDDGYERGKIQKVFDLLSHARRQSMKKDHHLQKLKN